MKKAYTLVFLLMFLVSAHAEDGYQLWLRYKKTDVPAVLLGYRAAISGMLVKGNSSTMQAVRDELKKGLSGMLDKQIPEHVAIQQGSVVVGSLSDLKDGLDVTLDVPENREGFLIKTITDKKKSFTVICSSSDIGLLYGTFHFLRLMQMNAFINNLNIKSSPSLKLRLLNHWDNLNRHVERGYAGWSIWNWHTLPDYKDPRYTDYARANASLGINGVTVTNVNANAQTLTPLYLEKLAALADIFRPYGIRLYLTARFNAPMELDKLKTADPLNEEVIAWWKKKTEEIYKYIPDFGGFLVKANSEGQPGPQNFQRTHADGANMLADAVADKGGIVIWRAFVYNPESKDRFKQAYEEFKPLDGQFRKNVLVQVKNGPIDFQPREPFSPLLGGVSKTPLMMEFQITQEYLGQATHLVYLAPMFKEVLDSDTYAKGKGSTVRNVISGKVFDQDLTGMSGVSNIGNDRNWTGHLFGQANWYAYGRLTWDLNLSSEKMADEWIHQTFGSDPLVVNSIRKMMMSSHENLVKYMTPLGLAHIMGNGHHYGPLPWGNTLGRPDWNPVYYHKADQKGIGFDRTTTGSNALSQYHPDAAKEWIDPDQCPEKYLLWFHHVAWDKKMKSGKTLWNEMVDNYYAGVQETRKLIDTWYSLAEKIDSERFNHVLMLLKIQEKEAVWWRNACLLYFQTFSKMPIPSQYEQPDKTLEQYMKMKFPYAPGN
jgi:alpha-glucuronidase